MILLTALVSLDFIYALTGLALMIFAALTLADRGNPHGARGPGQGLGDRATAGHSVQA